MLGPPGGGAEINIVNKYYKIIKFKLQNNKI
jgi:hypothetical protein